MDKKINKALAHLDKARRELKLAEGCFQEADAGAWARATHKVWRELWSLTCDVELTNI